MLRVTQTAIKCEDEFLRHIANWLFSYAWQLDDNLLICFLTSRRANDY